MNRFTPRRIAALLGVVFLIVVVICVVRVGTLKRYRVDAPPADADVASAAITVERFATAITFPTISTQDSATFDPAPFTEFHTWIEDAFPNLMKRLTNRSQVVINASFGWLGSAAATIVTPELTGVSGFNSAWLPSASLQTRWSVTVTGTNLTGSQCMEGGFIRTERRVGSM